MLKLLCCRYNDILRNSHWSLCYKRFGNSLSEGLNELECEIERRGRETREWACFDLCKFFISTPNNRQGAVLYTISNAPTARLPSLVRLAKTSPNTIFISDAGNSQTCRTIFQGQSQAVQRAVDQPLSRLPITSTSATPSSSATSISTTNSTSTFQEIC